MNRAHAPGLGASLKSARRAARLTQTELVAMAGMCRNALAAVEAGRGHVATLVILAGLLNLELSGRALPGKGSICERLMALRKQRRLSRRKAAVLAQISVPAIEVCERGGTGHVASLEAFGRAIGAGLCLVPIGTTAGFWESAATSSASDEWYTPAWVLERVVKVVGIFHTDPCSPGRGKSQVRAALHFTVADDGLSHDWPGTVWMNPLYGKNIGHWMSKARHEVAVGHARCVVALVPARTDTRWWHDHVAGQADVVLLKGRIVFQGGEHSAPFPSALVAYGVTTAERQSLFEIFPDAWHIAGPRMAMDSTPFIIAEAADWKKR